MLKSNTIEYLWLWGCTASSKGILVSLCSIFGSKINRESLREFLVKTPLVIKVKGREFITGDANYTIGKTIRIRFLDTNPYLDDQNAKFDLKKSGDYLIMTAKLVFSDEAVTTELTCGRVASLGVEVEL